MKEAMTCRDGVRLLMEYTEGLLSRPRRAAVDSHVGSCRRCRGFVRSYSETPRLLREATASPLPAPVGRRLRRVVSALPARRGRRP